MWTDESKEAELVAEVVGEQSARALLFQARVNIELYKHSCLELHQSLKNWSSITLREHMIPVI